MNPPFHNAFGALGALREKLPEGKAPGPAKKPEPKAPPKAVVRYERKGRGGKEVTVVEQLALPAAELSTWLSELKRALGCGGTVEDGALVIQGDQRERVKAWLEKRGVKKVSVG